MITRSLTLILLVSSVVLFAQGQEPEAASVLLQELGVKAQAHRAVHLKFRNQVEYPGTNRKREPYTTEIWWRDSGNEFRFSDRKQGREDTILLNQEACFSWTGRDGKRTSDIRREARGKFVPGKEGFGFMPLGVTGFLLQGAKGYSGLLRSFLVSYHAPPKEHDKAAWFVLTPKDGTADKANMGDVQLRLGVDRQNGLPVGLVMGDKRRLLTIEQEQVEAADSLPAELFESPTEETK